MSGNFVYRDYFRKCFYKIIQKANVPKIKFHDLRHTHATLLLKQGVNPKIVSERLGHSNISMTLSIYSHVLPNMQEDAVKNFAKAFSDDNVCKMFAIHIYIVFKTFIYQGFKGYVLQYHVYSI